MVRRPPRSTPLYSSAASDVYKRQLYIDVGFRPRNEFNPAVTNRPDNCFHHIAEACSYAASDIKHLAVERLGHCALDQCTSEIIDIDVVAYLLPSAEHFQRAPFHRLPDKPVDHGILVMPHLGPVSYTHLRDHE